MKRTYSCDNPECRLISSNPDKCPFCGSKDMSLYEEYEEAETIRKDSLPKDIEEIRCSQ